MKNNIIFENNDFLVIDKPPGINSDDFELRVHRLDKDTSGVLLIAKNEKTLEFLQREFQERKVRKKYIALVVGHLNNERGQIETLISRAPKDRRKQKAYLGEKEEKSAKTTYRVLQKLENYDLIELELHTGRKHQIRAHMVYLGHPIAGDKLYGFKNQPCPKGLSRQFLHSTYLEIKTPSGEIMEFKSELPEELSSIIKSLETDS